MGKGIHKYFYQKLICQFTSTVNHVMNFSCKQGCWVRYGSQKPSSGYNGTRPISYSSLIRNHVSELGEPNAMGGVPSTGDKQHIHMAYQESDMGCQLNGG